MNTNSYYSNENYASGLSSRGIQGQVYDRGGMKNSMLRQVDGKSYVVVNPSDPNQVEKFGSFSISAAVRPPYNSSCMTCQGCKCDRNGMACKCPKLLGVT